MVVCVTDPSGGVSYYCYGGGGEQDASRSEEERNLSEEEKDDKVEHLDSDQVDMIIIGGNERADTSIRQRLVEQLRGIGSHGSGTGKTTGDEAGEEIQAEQHYARALRTAMSAVVEALVHLPDTSGKVSMGRDRRRRDQGQEVNDEEDYGIVAGQIDLVIMTERAGVQRLGRQQIIDLMESVRKAKELAN